MCTTVVVCNNWQFDMAIDIRIVCRTYNEKTKIILVNKRDDNNSFLSTKYYNDLIEDNRKSKMHLKSN